MTKKEVDEKVHDKKLADMLIEFDKYTDNQYNNEGYCYICIQCGDFIENRDNVVIFSKDCYHLKCMIKVHEFEKESRDY